MLQTVNNSQKDKSVLLSALQTEISSTAFIEKESIDSSSMISFIGRKSIIYLHILSLSTVIKLRLDEIL